MRAFSLLPGLLLLLCTHSYAQWSWSNPHPSGYLNNAIVFADPQNGFIVNYNGDLIRTTDQGTSWFIQQNFPTAITIDYKDSTAVIGAGGKIYYSTDGGQTWSIRIPSVSVQSPFTMVNIVSRDTIFIASKDPSIGISTVWRSNDRGNSWVQLPNAVDNISSLSMTDSKTGYATTPSGVFKTTDAWQTSSQVRPFASLFDYVKFRNRDIGFVYSPYSNTITKTIDGGAHWAAPVSIGFDICGLAFPDGTSIVAAGETATTWRSNDDGNSWTYHPGGLIDHLDFFSIGFATPTVGFVGGIGGVILKTTDGGLTWSKYVPVYTNVDAVHFATDSVGFMGTWNTVYKTSDRGNNWVQLSLTGPTSTDRFKYIHFFSRDTGIAVSDAPVRVYKTYNSGSTWQLMNLNTLYNDDILGVSTVNRTVYLSTNGAYGNKILKSEDAGETWRVQITSSGFGAVYYNNLEFTDEKTGYALNGYMMYKTVDSAKTWTQLQIIQLQFLRSISFPTKLTGYVAGDQAYLLKTSDSGHTWTQLHVDPTNANVPGNITQVKFFNYKIGYLVAGSDIYRTITGGSAWHKMEPAASTLKGIAFTPDSMLFVYGINGEVLRRGIRGWDVDSVRFDSIKSCSARISARINTVFTTVDSAWFQYGTSAYSNQVLMATAIADTSVRISLGLQNLSQNTSYKARVKISYQGIYYYSDSIQFTTAPQPTPTISFLGGVMHSSQAQGNQWYLNNVAIPGATLSSYTPTQSGSYTVQTILDGCASAMSAPVAFVPTAITNPALASGISIFPNPVDDWLFVKNSEQKKLQVDVFNSVGTRIMSMQTSKKENRIDTRLLAAGVYMIRITELKTGRQTSGTIVKL